MRVREFVDHYFHHFNAAQLREAARAYERFLQGGNKMFITLAGAMSTAELGKILAEMIRRDKVHAICCTGANLEEDLYNLVAHEHYERVPRWRELTEKDEAALLKKGLNRVTDTCIPEDKAIRKIEKSLLAKWQEAERHQAPKLPHQFFYEILASGELKSQYQIPPENSWLYEAQQKNLPLFVPGWEDSTCGNIFASYCIAGELRPTTIRSGIEYMVQLAEWYQAVSKDADVGFFQIGGGIAGDFPICVVPMLHQDLEKKETKCWKYFCQISDSTTSYGSYSGALPNEKITWGKLDPGTPKFVIESDATIVAPLIFAYILDM